MIAVTVLGAALFVLKNGGGLKGAIPGAYLLITGENYPIQPDSFLLDDQFRDVIKFQAKEYNTAVTNHITFNNIKISVLKYKNNNIVDGNVSACASFRLVLKNQFDVVLSDVVDMSSTGITTITFRDNSTPFYFDNDFIDFAIQSRLKQNCTSSNVDSFIARLNIGDISYTADRSLPLSDIAELLIGKLDVIPPSVILNVQNPGQPTGGNMPKVGALTDVLRVNIRVDGNTELSAIHLNLIVPEADTHPSHLATLSNKLGLAFFLKDKNNTEIRVSGPDQYFDNNSEKDFALSGAQLTPDNSPYILIVKAAPNSSDDNPSFRLRIDGFIGTRMESNFPQGGIITNKFTIVPSLDSELSSDTDASVGAFVSASQIKLPSIGNITKIDTNNPTSISVPLGSQSLTDVFKFKITTTEPNKFIKQIIFKLKDQRDSVDINKLNFVLFDTTPEPDMPNIFATINSTSNTVTFNNDSHDANSPISWPAGHEFALKISPKAAAVGSLNNKKITIGIENNSSVSVHDSVVNFLGAPTWGSNYTFVDNNRAAPPPPAVIECTAENKCIHSITLDTIDAQSFQSGDNTLKGVFGFTITPSRNTTLSSLTVSLDSTGQLHPAAGSRIKAELVMLNTHIDAATHSSVTTEQVLAGPFFPTYGSIDSYTFRQLGRTLFANTPKKFIIRAKIVDQNGAVDEQQTFKFAIKNVTDVVLTMNNAVSLPSPILGNLMTIAAADAQVAPAQCGEHEQANPAAPGCICTGGFTYDSTSQQCVEQNDGGNDALNVCADGQQLNAQNQCVAIPVVDACPATPAIEESIPAGGCPIPPPPSADLCINIPDVQATMPTGKMGDGAGGCVNIPVRTPEKTCTEQGKFEYAGPTRGGLSNGTCIPCPVKDFISSNMTCIISATGDSKDKTSGSSGSGTNTANGSSSASGSTSGSASNSGTNSQLHGSALDAGLNGSTRLVRMPERGNTGPDASMYIAFASLSPAAAYLIRKIRSTRTTRK